MTWDGERTADPAARVPAGRLWYEPGTARVRTSARATVPGGPSRLGLAKSASLPVLARLQDALTTLEKVNAALKLYLVAANEKKVGGRELVELVGFQLAAMDTLMELGDAQFAAVSKDDPAYDARAKGMAQARGGAATVVNGALTSVNEQSVYLPSDRVVLIKALQRSLPGIFPRLTEDARREIVLRLKALSEDAALGELRPEARSLYEIIAAK